MKNSEEILRHLQEEAQCVEIPESIKPEQIEKKIKQYETQKTAERRKNRRNFRKTFAAAACIGVILIGGVTFSIQQRTAGDHTLQNETIQEEAGQNERIQNEISGLEGNSEPAEAEPEFADVPVGIEYPEIEYEDIYASMSKKWAESERMMREEVPADAGLMVEAAEESGAFNMVSDSADQKKMASYEGAEYGETNVQTAGVDEGDIVKNDGRYLYQKIQVEEENRMKWAIQIIDTKDGLKEVSCVDDFDGLVEFYVWEDTLIVIEEKYFDQIEELSTGGRIVCCDVAYYSNDYHEISFYNIENRSRPLKINTFTLQGQYTSSRIADGYFYGFSKCYADPGEGKTDYDAYIPIVDGTRLQADKIYLPEENEETSYLVLVAVDLEHPEMFTDTTAVVSGADIYYVSSENIFVADTKSAGMEEGLNSNSTSLLKFSYGNGKFTLQSTGEVKGNLEGSFSMDEYNGYLRVVSTVREYQTNRIVDDRTGEEVGYSTSIERQTNALYILDENLKQTGKIEGLAEDEQIYSARFMGDTGYFVTFRQTDPLFAVDLSDPENPQVLSQLKVSGFSEYLHIYGEDTLLGIGMEADEETGVQQGMKLSMFDVSDKSNVQEFSRLRLEDYNYSEALYNHRAVMISTQKNLFGFEAEGSSRGAYWRKYFVFSYEDNAFVQRLKVDTKGNDGNYHSVRGTFIGDVFYLLIGDGSVKSYDLNTGEQLENLYRKK